jgi:U3 small nucleolar RNA-associated protein 10
MALSIFADRLPLVKPDVRSHCAAEIASILTKTSSRLTRPAAVVSSALAGIRTVAQTALDSEDAALAQVLPRVVESVGGFPDTTNLTAALSLIDLTLSVLPFK